MWSGRRDAKEMTSAVKSARGCLGSCREQPPNLRQLEWGGDGVKNGNRGGVGLGGSG